MSERCEYIRTSGTTHWCALAAEPHQWADLTDDEIVEALGATQYDSLQIHQVRNVIKAFKEKNT